MSTLHLVVGPNGAGKSTFIERYLHPQLPSLPFVNADVIAKQNWPDEAESRSYEAARIAEATREALITSHRSFIAGTVFSHPSKVELIRTATDHDFDVYLHIVMVPEDMSVERVRLRVAAGGHSVPEDKIRELHRRLWANTVAAIPLAYTSTCYDNSRRTGPAPVAKFAQGFPVGAARWPQWAPSELTDLWIARGGATA